MKTRNFIALSALALAAASCSSDVEEQASVSEKQTAIGVGTYFGDVTRGTHVDNDGSRGIGLQTTGFKLYANVNEASTGKVSPLMNNQLIEYDAVANEWKYTPIKYWPTETASTVDFYPRYEGVPSAVDPLSVDAENIKSSYDWNNIPQVTFYVNDVVSKQTDYIWAAPLLGKKLKDYESTNGKVDFTFKHALSAFTFKLLLDISDEDLAVTRVIVNSVSVTGYFAPKATLNPRETDIAKIWNLQGDWEPRTYTISKDGENEMRRSNASVSGYYGNTTAQPITWPGWQRIDISGTPVLGRGTIMVLPYGGTKEYTVTLDYDVITYETSHEKDTDNSGTHGHKQNYKISKVVTMTDPLEAGKIYENTLKLTMTSISVGATVKPWDTSNTTDVTLP